jgi:two-component system response regulator YesN
MVDGIHEICWNIAQNKKNKNKFIIKSAIQLIEQNYYKQYISVNYIAKKLFITPNYLSNLFKIETGENFSDSLGELRINKAKEILLDIQYSISNIAYKIGFNDPKYFSKVFKKVTGETPKNYRSHH